MPALIPTYSNTTTTVQNIMDGCAQDVRQVISSASGAGVGILIDYANRINLQLLRASNWQFLVSQPQQFVTAVNATAYWLGTVGGGGLYAVDTGLGLSDIRVIRQDSVYDRTNNLKLYKTDWAPIGSNVEYSDGSYRPGRPKQYMSTFETPYLLNLYPAPDNQTTYTPIPEGPICYATFSAGSLPARFYYVRVTFVDSLGNESQASNETKVFIPANMLVTVAPPKPPLVSASGVQYIKYNVYASEVIDNESLQTVSTISTNIVWTEPTSGITTTGAAFPTSTLIEPIDGYLIEFRYYKIRQQLTVASQVLQIPDDYKDVIIAGVNWLGNKYLKRMADAREWQQVYMAGLGEIIRDKNQFPHGADFISPDPASINNNYNAVQTIDPGIGGGL